MRRILLHAEYKEVICVLNEIVSASKPMMAELRKLEVLIRVMGSQDRR